VSDAALQFCISCKCDEASENQKTSCATLRAQATDSPLHCACAAAACPAFWDPNFGPPARVQFRRPKAASPPQELVPYIRPCTRKLKLFETVVRVVKVMHRHGLICRVYIVHMVCHLESDAMRFNFFSL
jgi:hypothetical protein